MSTNFFKQASPDHNFIQNFKPILITSFEQLKEVIEVYKDSKTVAFDTETTGLTFYEDKIVGFSFSFNSMHGYYVPLRHNKGENLPIESLTYFYEHVLLTKTVLMFNVIFDNLMLQGDGLDPFKIKFFDVLVLIYNLDTGALSKGLKPSTVYYLGRPVPTFEETVMQQSIIDASNLENTTLLDLNSRLASYLQQHISFIEANKDKPKKEIKVELKELETKISDLKKEIKSLAKIINNMKTKAPKHILFSDITPEQAYNYASCDTANTFGLFEKFYPFMSKECPISIELLNGTRTNILGLDNMLLRSMMYYQQNSIYIDTEKMKDLCEELSTDLENEENEIFEFFGYRFNLDSTPELGKALQTKGISTGTYSDKNPERMLVNKQALGKIDHPIMKKIISRNSTHTQLNNYASKFTEQKEGKVSYNCLSASTGRLLSGNSGGANRYFMNLNFQNLTKPKTIMYRAIHKSNSVYESIDTHEILDYKFVPVKDDEYYSDENGKKQIGKMILNGVEIDDSMYIVEGPSPKRNIRSAVITPDKDWYFMSIDYTSEELAIAGILSGEPNYLEPYRNKEDIHLQTAYAMWGKENYTPQKRKYAKTLNFALLYGGSVYTLVNGEIKMDPQVAEESFVLFWKGLAVLKRWQESYLREVRNNTAHPDRRGTGYTYFGRPRRFPNIFSDNFKDMKKAEREALNIPVQGTAADIIRIDLVNLYQSIWQNNKENENEIRFIGTVHDEIDLAVKKDQFYKWLPKLKEIIEIKFPERDLTLRCEFEVGTNFGYTFAFEQDEQGVMHPKRA